ncbi:dihydrofolate reductase [Fangia hongkongensis]|uniref:dihydrofolate reductase n=1 Tax=Fangia hongkongensis TaxID=270495 RepID=UPI00036D7DA5|nr:dihydrofolate reductase [Fangia hongkongensis]MBK2126044.1 dihydrofolate reductase [Fangia hongkongensis]
MLSIIVAYDQNLGIGIKNTLPWKLSDDLKNFKQVTEHNYIVMGRKTYESIGRPLPNRKNIILTRNSSFKQEKCIIIDSIDKVLNLAKEKPHMEIFIIGGAEIYELFLPHVHRLYITKVNAKIKADAFFPKWQESEFKRIGQRHYAKDQNNEFDFDFEVWEKQV